MDVNFIGLSVVHDRAGSGDVLRRVSAEEECVGSDDAVRIFNGIAQRDLGSLWLFVIVWR